MRIARTGLLASVLVAGCSTSFGPAAGPRPAAHQPAARRAPSLFVSDAGTGNVYIYQLATLKVVGKVTGFTQPEGECTDERGNVWVTDARADTVYELSHEGHLENELHASGTPVGCAIDPKSGDLAVMSLFGASTSAGAVSIFAKAKGTPRTYSNPKQYYYDFGGYDERGNLFFDGRTETGAFILSELPKSAKSAATIALTGGTVYFPGMVQWDASNNVLIVGDQACENGYSSCLYTVSIASSAGTIESQIPLQSSNGGAVCDLVQGVEYDGQIAGSNNDFCDSKTSSTDVWPYPGGGLPTEHNAKADTSPIGAAVSP